MEFKVLIIGFEIIRLLVIMEEHAVIRVSDPLITIARLIGVVIGRGGTLC